MTGKKIIELYTALKLNRTQFAQKIGYRHSTIIRIEEGTIASLSPKLCKAIYSAFPQVNPVWLETGKGEMFAEKKGADEGEIQFPNDSQSREMSAIWHHVDGQHREKILSYARDVNTFYDLHNKAPKRKKAHNDR